MSSPAQIIAERAAARIAASMESRSPSCWEHAQPDVMTEEWRAIIAEEVEASERRGRGKGAP